MVTLRRKDRRAIVVGLLVVAATLVAGNTARADAAAFTDGNDTTSKLDVSSGSVTNNASTITYTVTMDPFTATDVNKILFEFDFNNNGVADNCLRVQQASTASGLEGVIYDGCNGSLTVGSADAVNIVGGNQLQALVNINELRNAGLGNGSSYRFRVLTVDTPSQNNLPPFANDTAPNSGFVTHKLGKIVCGALIKANVKLTQDMTGCRGDGLVVGKSGKKVNGKIKYLKINLNGFDIVSAFNGTSFLNGSGIKVGIRKYIQITGGAGGTISGFNNGIELNGTNLSQVKGVKLTNNSTGLAAIGGSKNTLSGNTVQSSKDNAATVDKEGVGLSVTGTKHKVTSNNVTGNPNDGIRSTSGSGITFTSNISSTNGTQPPDAAALTGDGMDIDSSAAKLVKNKADTNDGDGISAPSGATGSGNTATGNAGTNCAVPAAVGCA